MERRAWSFNVEATDQGHICISQGVAGLENDEEVLIHPDQVDLLVKWLNEVREELQQE